MWNFDYGLNSFNMFNFWPPMQSFYNFGFGQGLTFSPLFNFDLPAIYPFSFGSFGYTPSETSTEPVPSATSTEPVPSATSKTPVTETKAAEASRINKISSNQKRIIEYNKTNYKGDYYGIVDKKNCKLTIYDKSGKVIKSYTLGLGEDKGDGISGGKYTTAGEFTLDENVRGKDAADYTASDKTYNLMALRGDNIGPDGKILAIHAIPNSLKHQRDARMKSETISDNRMSNGCVNMNEKDYKGMSKYLGEGCKIYVLPEEAGNELVLTEQTDGSYKFEQKYHKKDKRGLSKDAASVVVYDRPNRYDTYI